ncbi:MAG: hypothetical protein JO323_11600 [Acidobacteriia bacterium]|nr:hypothetical protein [Terriglobia bacterium]
MADLSNIKLKSGSLTICEATEGSSGIGDSLVKLTGGVQWKTRDPLTFLQKKVRITAAATSLVRDDSLDKEMYITKLSNDYGEVVLGNNPVE